MVIIVGNGYEEFSSNPGWVWISQSANIPLGIMYPAIHPLSIGK